MWVVKHLQALIDLTLLFSWYVDSSSGRCTRGRHLGQSCATEQAAHTEFKKTVVDEMLGLTAARYFKTLFFFALFFCCARFARHARPAERGCWTMSLSLSLPVVHDGMGCSRPWLLGL